MSIVAIIAEYNPFHSGHAYQLEKAKEITGADHALVIMSGDFVQRGSAAIMDKYLRCRMALQSGADCVLELPFWIATAPALDFARGAVRILNALGCVDYLCFGAESADLCMLMEAAGLFQEEPMEFQTILREKLSSASSYASARQEAYEAYTGKEASFLALPNNILAIAYLQALIGLRSEIKPVAIRRQGDYHAESMQGSFSSATAVRNRIHKGEMHFYQNDAIPPSCAELYTSYYQKGYPIDDHAYWPMLKLRLLQYRTCAERIYDFPLDLARRFEKHAMEASSYDELVKLLASPAYTNSRIHRCLLHLLFELQEKEVSVWKATDACLYARVLGFRKEHSSMLKQLKDHALIPVLTKALADKELAAYPDMELRQAVYELDLMAANLYSMLQKDAWNQNWQHEYCRKLITV